MITTNFNSTTFFKLLGHHFGTRGEGQLEHNFKILLAARRSRPYNMRTVNAVFAFLALWRVAVGADVISTNGFSSCSSGGSTITVENLDISFDRTTNKITFDVAGKSDVEQDVTASLIVQAYGVNVYNQTFDPCAEDTKVDQLCPGKCPVATGY